MHLRIVDEHVEKWRYHWSQANPKNAATAKQSDVDKTVNVGQELVLPERLWAVFAANECLCMLKDLKSVGNDQLCAFSMIDRGRLNSGISLLCSLETTNLPNGS
jgi:hypothetical protein